MTKKWRREVRIDKVVIKEAIRLFEGSNLSMTEISKKLQVPYEILKKSMDEYYSSLDEREEQSKGKLNSNSKRGKRECAVFECSIDKG